MAKNFMSNILDELMGRDRDALPNEKPKKLSWEDPDMCSHYLVCFCPHELFVNTKADLGPCPKLHDEQIRARYLEEAPPHRKLHFENEFIRFAEKMIQDIEGKIKRGRMRIQLANGPDGGTYAGPGSKNAEKIALLTERINVLIKEAEEAGCEGDIEKAQGLLKLCDQLKEEREQLKSNEINHPWNPDKAMQVCEVCGSYLIIGEAQHRLDDHIMGKQHVGFAMLRKTLEDVRKAREVREQEERDRLEKERLERRKGRDREIRERDREKRDIRKSRSRSRDRKRKAEKRKRSRSRSPRRRSRSRDKKDKEREREKDRKRDSSRDRRSKDDRDRRRSKRSRSRSRDRHRSKRSSSRDRKSKDKKHRDRDKDREKDKGSSSDKKGDKEDSARKLSSSSLTTPPTVVTKGVEAEVEPNPLESNSNGRADDDPMVGETGQISPMEQIIQSQSSRNGDEGEELDRVGGEADLPMESSPCC